MTTTPAPVPRIRWERNDDGSHVTPAHEGHAGTIGEPLFFIFEPDDRDPWWILTSSLPGLPGAGRAERRAHGDDTDSLRAEAERWLEEFAVSLGAVFPRSPRKPPREPKPRHTGFAPGVAGLANTARAARAGTRDAAAARELLARYNLTPREISVATTRARHPEWTWAQIGAALGMTKDQAWGTFRRMRAECATAIPADRGAGR